MKRWDVHQGTEEWLRARLGRPTASRFADILTLPREKSKREAGELSSTAKAYLCECAAEYMLLEPLDGGSTTWMQRGSEMERAARAWYAMHKDVKLDPGGFFTLDDDPLSPGCSPDGLVRDDCGMELKILSAKHHVAALMDPQKFADSHYAQCQGGLWITRRKKWDLVAWNPSLPSLVVPIERDDCFIERLDDTVEEFVYTLREFLREQGYIGHD